MTKQKKEQIQYLLLQYMEGKASTREAMELSGLLAEEKDDNAWEDLMEELYATEPAVENYQEKEWQRMIDELIRVNAEREKRAIRHFPFWRKIAAASVIILAIGTGAYFLFFNRSHKPGIVVLEPIEKRYQNDVPPGSNGAILTLSEGTKINIDSAANGMIAQQGNINVIKQGDLLSYNEQGKSGEAVKYNTMTTPRGKQYSFVLADGSKIAMNSESSITYPTSFAGTERRVQFTGEIYFEVANNARMPFIAQKNDLNVQVLGTHFNINAYDDEPIIKTTLVEGSVKVTLRQAQGDKVRMLSPGQQVQINKKDIKLIENADVEEAVAWINGMFSFKSADIETIMKQIGRWYDVDIVYEKNIPAKEIRGKASRSTNLASLLKVLEMNGVHFKIEGKKITVMPG